MKNITRHTLTKKQYNQLCNLVPEIRNSPNIDFYQQICQKYKKLSKKAVRKFMLDRVMAHPFMHHKTSIKKIISELLDSNNKSSKKK